MDDKAITILPRVSSDGEAMAIFSQFRDLVDDAMEASTRNDWPETARLLSEAALLARLPPFLRVHLAEAWGWSGEPLKAVSEYETALEEEPDDPRAWENLAVARLQVGRYEDARSAALEAVRRAPDNAHAWLNLGVAERKTGRAPEGRRSFENAVRLDPGLFAAWKNLGNACRDGKEWDAAEKCYRKALEIDRFRRDVLKDLAFVLKHKDKIDAAHAALRQAVHLEPSDPDGWFDMIAFCCTNNLYAEARVAYRHLLQLDPDCARRLCVQMADQGKALERALGKKWESAPITEPNFWNWTLSRPDGPPFVTGS